MTTHERILTFYTQPGVMTALGDDSAPPGSLPRDIPALVEVVQGALLHEHMAGFAYGITLTDEHRAETHTRPASCMLERLREHGGRLSVALPTAERVVGTCRNFSVLFVALLRAQGISARARCGFGTYFTPGRFEDHWVAEYWNAAEKRWVQVDAQIDAVQWALLKIDFDLLDVPRDRFVIAGDAWARCRAGEADPATFGMSFMNEGGLWWIAGNLVRDVAALNNMEMLPWDVWGAMPGPDDPITDEHLALFDRLAALTHEPDAAFDELRAAYERDERLRVPAAVFNAVLHEPQAV